MKRLLSFVAAVGLAALIANAIPAGAALRAVSSVGSGVTDIACTNQFLRAFTSGIGTCASVSAGQVSGLATVATSGSAADLGTGTLPNARLTAGQFPGTPAADSASAGNIGEYVSTTVASGSAISLTNNTPAVLASISLTAGDWDISCQGTFFPAGTTTVSTLVSSIALASAAINNTGSNFAELVYPSSVLGVNTITAIAGPSQRSFASTTTVYCNLQAGFGTSTMTAYGIIRARRMR